MFLEKMIVNKLDLFPLMCATLSVLSGIAGYKMAITQDPQGIKVYIATIAMSMTLQVFLATIASNRKDKLIRVGSTKVVRSLRVDLVIIVAWVIAATAIFLAASDVENCIAELYLALIFTAVAFQFATFTAAGREQIRNPSRFWAIQLSGALARVIGTGLFVAWCGIGFGGILISNLIAAVVVCRLYANWPTVRLRRLNRLVAIIRSGRFMRIFRLDGFLRAGKGLYEAVATSLCAIVVDRSGLLPRGTVEASYMAVGYLNTLSTTMRQVFSGWELQSGQSLFAQVFSVFLSVGAAVFVFWIHFRFQIFDIFLPNVARESLNHIVISVSIFLALYPLTRGFLYADYLPPEDLLRFAFDLVLAYVSGMCLLMLIFWGLQGGWALAWFAPVPLSIGFAIFRCHARIA